MSLTWLYAVMITVIVLVTYDLELVIHRKLSAYLEQRERNHFEKRGIDQVIPEGAFYRPLIDGIYLTSMLLGLARTFWLYFDQLTVQTFGETLREALVWSYLIFILMLSLWVMGHRLKETFLLITKILNKLKRKD